MGKVSRLDLATGGLFFSWLIHDLEEYVTMPGRAHPFTGALPFMPAGVRAHGVSRDQTDIALTLVGALMAAASIDGYRTRGRSPFYQAMLYGYGMHALIHLASALTARRYTSGAATALPVVLPFWLFANAALRADGIEVRPRRWTIAAFPVVGLVVYGVGYLASGRRIGAAS